MDIFKKNKNLKKKYEQIYICWSHTRKTWLQILVQNSLICCPCGHSRMVRRADVGEANASWHHAGIIKGPPSNLETPQTHEVQ